MHPLVDLAGSAGIAGAAQADLEPLVAKVEQHLGALADSLHVRNIPEIEQQAQALHRALARAVEGFMLVARHGSHPPIRVGYDVVRVIGRSNEPLRMELFLTGFLQGLSYWGRPVDVLTMADGAVLVSDDLNGAIYRVAPN